MSDAGLRRLYAAIVLGLAVWPGPHTLLTEALGSDPWKNLGLAMYATQFDVMVDAWQREGDGTWTPVERKGEAFEALVDFAERRRTRGVLHSPDALARALGDLIGTDGVRIAVTNQSLDGRIGILEIVRRERFEYRIGPDGVLTGGLVPAGGGEP